MSTLLLSSSSDLPSFAGIDADILSSCFHLLIPEPYRKMSSRDYRKLPDSPFSTALGEFPEFGFLLAIIRLTSNNVQIPLPKSTLYIISSISWTTVIS